MCYRNRRDFLTLTAAGGFFALLAGPSSTARADNLPWLADSKAVLRRLRGIARWMMDNQSQWIYIEGYNERTLLAFHEITGEQPFLDHVRKWVKRLLDLQKPDGYWGTGYGDVYFADTGSALGLLVNFYKFAAPDERRRIDDAFRRYFHLLLVKGDTTGKPFLHEDGSLGCGFQADIKGNVTGNWSQPYTIATALTGAEAFAAWYYMKGNDRDKQIAVKACDWILGTIAGDPPSEPLAQPGEIPYLGDPNELTLQGKAKANWIWKEFAYGPAAYAGEGFIAAWTYIDDKGFRQNLVRRMKPHIEWLLRTQNEDGSWARKGSEDQKRSHGVVNVLVWWHGNVERDPRVAEALGRYCRLVLDEDRCRYFNLPGEVNATALGGRALATILKPGVDCNRWERKGDKSNDRASQSLDLSPFSRTWFLSATPS
jgi:hypothetical protein